MCHTALSNGLLIAGLDTIGGILGVFVCSLLLGTFWHMASYPQQLVVNDIVAAKFNDDNEILWGSGLTVLHQLASFDGSVGKSGATLYMREKFRSFVFVYVVLLYVLAILSALHILAGPLLGFGIFKQNVKLIKIWIAFKVIVIVLTTLVFLGLCWRFTIFTIIIYAIFLTLNIVFLVAIKFLISSKDRLSGVRGVSISLPSESERKGYLYDDEDLELQRRPPVDRAVAVSGNKFQLEYASSRFGVLDQCIKCLEGRGLHHQGLYRVENEGYFTRNKVQKVLSSLIRNPNLGVKSLDLEVNVLASLIKEIVSKRVIPPIISTDQLPQIEEIAQMTDEDRCLQMKEFISQLPPPNFAALRILFIHLTKVASVAQFNGMDSKNLAVSWWSTLFPYIITKAKAKQVDPAIRDLFQSMIDNSQFYFALETTVES